MLVSGTVVTKIMFLLFLHMKRCFITDWKASLIRTQKIPSQLESANNFWKLATSKQPKQHPNCLEASCISKEVFLNIGIYKRMIFPRYDYPKERYFSFKDHPTIPISVASRALISPRWCLSTNCGSSAPKNSRPSRPATATAREKEKAKADLEDWKSSTTCNHVNEMTLWYPMISLDHLFNFQI